MEPEPTGSANRPFLGPPVAGRRLEKGIGRMAFPDEQAELLAVGDPCAEALEPAVPEARRLVTPLVVRARLAVVGPGVVPGSDLDLEGPRRVLEDAKRRVAVAVEQAADEVRRNAQLAWVPAQGVPAPELPVDLVLQVGEEPGANVEA